MNSSPPLLPRCVTFVGNAQFFLLLLLVWLSFPERSWAGTTSLLLRGEPGEFIVGNDTLFYGSLESTFSAQGLSSGIGVRINVQPAAGGTFDLRFAMPAGTMLLPGEYLDARRYPFQPAGKPGLAISGMGRGCNTLSGNFTIHQVELNGAQIVKFWATFEQHCEFAAAVLRGEVRFNADVPVHISAPSLVTVHIGEMTSFNISSLATNGGAVFLSANEVPAGAVLNPLSASAANFSWSPSADQIGIHDVVFAATNSVGESDISITRILVKAAVPVNDEFTNATVITQLPFIDALNTSEATSAGELPACVTPLHTVWYAFTAASNMTIEVSTAGSDFTGELTVLASAGGAAPSFQMCHSAFLRFRALEGHTYYFRAGIAPYERGSNLVFSLTRTPVEIPDNDEVTNATVITSVPFTDALNNSVATKIEDQGLCQFSARTVWYVLNLPDTTSVEMTTEESDFQGSIAVFNGTPSLSTMRHCGQRTVRFRAEGGQPYYIQVGALSDNGSNLVFSIRETVDVTRFGLSKAQVYLQKKARARARFAGGAFQSSLTKTTEGDVSFVTVRRPSGAEEGLGATTYLTLKEFQTESPPGDYTLTIGGVHDGTNDFVLTFPADHYPSVPQLNNWEAAQMVSAAHPFTFTWNPMIDRQDSDTVQVEVLDGGGSQSIFAGPALPGSSTSFVLPPGTLQPEIVYIGVIYFLRNVVTDTNLYPGATATVEFIRATVFPVETAAAILPGAGTLGFAARRYSLSESNGAVSVTVMRTQGSTGTVTVDFATVDRSAVGTNDFEAASGTLTFQEGETSQVVTIPIVADDQTEKAETFAIILKNPTGGAKMGLRRTQVQVTD